MQYLKKLWNSLYKLQWEKKKREIKKKRNLRDTSKFW
jgi:hypothetical protein